MFRVRNVIKNVYFRASVSTSTISGTIWTPASGKKFRVQGWLLKATVITTFSAGTPAGHSLVVYDNAVSTTSIIGIPPYIVTSSTQAAGGWYGTGAVDLGHSLDLADNLYQASAADNVVKVGIIDNGAAPALSTGLTGGIAIYGQIWGEEV